MKRYRQDVGEWLAVGPVEGGGGGSGDGDGGTVVGAIAKGKENDKKDLVGQTLFCSWRKEASPFFMSFFFFDFCFGTESQSVGRLVGALALLSRLARRLLVYFVPRWFRSLGSGKMGST